MFRLTAESVCQRTLYMAEIKDGYVAINIEYVHGCERDLQRQDGTESLGDEMGLW